ncbi:SirB2 family protein [Aliiglaciecola litoralis]|uniref:SirB2 family protein n=1 Tax=Aliiglaciecola litoralis TaxID=582857 RepID=A0ABN1LNZ2_9ALTE
MYIFTKHLHMTAVVLTILFFIVRFFWLMRGSDMLMKKWVKISPHIIDTILLASAVALCFLVPWNPLQHPWLWQKILLVVIYILMGFYVLKRANSTAARWTGFAVGMVCLALAGKMAVTKQALFLL